MSHTDTLNNNKRFVKAIRVYLKEKGEDWVYFQPNTYENENDIPFCNHFKGVVDSVSISKDRHDAIAISVSTPQGAVFQKDFDGTEDENFEYLFDEVYHYINGPEDPEMEEWLEEHGI